MRTPLVNDFDRRRGRQALHLEHGDRRQQAHEDEHERHEQADGAEEGCEVPARRVVHAQEPGRKSRCSDIGMITKRSNHMPTLTNIEMIQSAAIDLRTFANQSGWIASTLQRIRLIQMNRYGPKTRFRTMYHS